MSSVWPSENSRVMERPVKEVNDIIVLNAYKLFLRNAAQTPILLTLSTIVEKLNTVTNAHGSTGSR